MNQETEIIASPKNAFQNFPPRKKYELTSAGVLFAPESIYKTPLSSNAELLNLLTASYLLIPHKSHLKSTPFTFNIAMFFNS